MTINLTLALMGVVAALAALCGVILFALRRQPAMVWLGIALCIGVAESLALKDGNVTLIDKMLTFITVPTSYICVGQAVRAAYGAKSSGPRFFAILAALILTSLALIATSAPPVVQALFCQLAGVLGMLDAVRCLQRERRKGDSIDSILLGVLACVLTVYVIRIPLFPVLISEATPLGNISRDGLQTTMVAIFGILVPACVFLLVARVVVNAVDAYRLRAERDYLTDLHNRGSFEEMASRDCADGGALILCDIDNFKAVNDRFGHAAGDAVIRAFAALIDGQGGAARIGGEEFAIWLPGAELAVAKIHAENLRREFSTLLLVEVPHEHQLAASFGIARFGRHSPLALVTAQADAALYAAKNSGRNRVVVYGEDEAKSRTSEQGPIAAQCAA